MHIICCRSPLGERGLKYKIGPTSRNNARSLSAWRAWIEIEQNARNRSKYRRSLSAWRAWIEISRTATSCHFTKCRSPLGERGLKLHLIYRLINIDTMSLSAWRAWIEISFLIPLTVLVAGRSPLGERGLKYLWIA